MADNFIQNVCDKIEEFGGWAYVTEPIKREFDSILRDPSQCLQPLDEEMIRELSESLGSHLAPKLSQFFARFNQVIEQIEAIKEEQWGYEEEVIYPECEYDAAVASFGAKDETFAIRDGRVRNHEEGHFIYFNPEFNCHEDRYEWEGNCLGKIGKLPPKETAETLMRLVSLFEKSKIPSDYQEDAFQPLFDGNLDFTL